MRTRWGGKEGGCRETRGGVLDGLFSHDRKHLPIGVATLIIFFSIFNPPEPVLYIFAVRCSIIIIYLLTPLA